MSMKEDSDAELNKLRNESSLPKTSGGKKKKGKKTRKPNNRGGKARISARRIGGNLNVDFEAYRAAKLGTKMKSVDIPNQKASSMVSLKSNNRPRNSGRINGTLPRVQELGSTASMSSIPLRKSSRLNIGVTGRRRFSSGSNLSGAVEGINSSQSKEVIIRYGELQKRGVVTAQWKTRFFVLTHKHLFYFQEAFDVPQNFSQIDIQPKGKIDLAGVNAINKDKNDLNGATFEVRTPARTYKLRIEAEPTPKQLSGGITAQSLSKYFADAWVSALRGAIENAKQHASHSKVVRNRGSFSSVKVDEVDDANSNKNSYMHPARRIINSEVNIKAKTGPHQPANVDEVEDWTPFDVAAWLYTVHLQKYSEDFYQQGVDGKILKTLADESMTKLKEIGVEDEDIEDLTVAVTDLLKQTAESASA